MSHRQIGVALGLGLAIATGCSDIDVALDDDVGGTGSDSGSTAESAPHTSEADSSGGTTDAEGSTSSGPESSDDGPPDGVCGDFTTDPGEVCDDGNNEDGDGCNADCSEADCWVPVTHPTIQAAVDDPACPVVGLEPAIHNEQVIIGRDVELVGRATINGGGQGRVLEISAGSSVVLRDLTIRNGLAERGAGILSHGTLELRGVRVEGNDASGIEPCGGGVWSDGELILTDTSVSHNESLSVGDLALGAGICMVGGRLELREASEVSSNHARGTSSESARGGGIHATDSDVLISEGSEVHANFAEVTDPLPGATASGGGIYQRGGSLQSHVASLSFNRARLADVPSTTGEWLAEGGALTLVDVEFEATGSAFESNLASVGGSGTMRTRGGAIHLAGTTSATIRTTAFELNRVSAVAYAPDVATVVSGGAIDIAADDTMVTFDATESRWTRNSAGTYSLVDEGATAEHARGGAVHVGAQGAAGVAVARFDRCTLDDNQASAEDALAEGGALSLLASEEARVDVQVVNSTLYDNAAGFPDGRGGALVARSAGGEVSVHVRSSTLVRNDASLAEAIWLDPESPSILVDLTNTAVLDNGYGTDCDPSGTGIVSLGYNAFDDLECALSPAVGDLFLEDVALEWLSDNGGPTPTCAVLVDSPLRNAGDPEGCTSADSSPLTVDQRGEVRHAEGPCDIGAFEYTP